MLTVVEDNRWEVLTLVDSEGRKFVQVRIVQSLTQFEALRLARALEMASDHLTTT